MSRPTASAEDGHSPTGEIGTRYSSLIDESKSPAAYTAIPDEKKRPQRVAATFASVYSDIVDLNINEFLGHYQAIPGEKKAVLSESVGATPLPEAAYEGDEWQGYVQELDDVLLKEEKQANDETQASSAVSGYARHFSHCNQGWKVLFLDTLPSRTLKRAKKTLSIEAQKRK